MENIFPSSNIGQASGASAQDSVNRSTAEPPLTAELAGVKITPATEEPKIFSSLEGDTLETASLKEGADTSLHSFVQVHPSTTSLATQSTPTTDPSPSLSDEGKFDLRGVEEQRSLLEKRIKIAQELVYPSSQRGYRDFNECQERYVKNLQRILGAIDDLSSLSEGNLVKIESAINGVMNIADQLKQYTEKVIVARVAGKEPPNVGAAGELAEAFEHYLDYIHDIKIGNTEKESVDFCLTKKCFAKFKMLEAREQENQKESELFEKAFSCYTEAIENGSFGEKTLEAAGDCYASSAFMFHDRQQGLSELYEQAGICFEKANQPCRSQVQEEVHSHRQTAEYWALSGDNTINAINALQAKKTPLFELYNMARECFRRVAENILFINRDPEILKGIEALKQAGNHFASAAEEIKKKTPNLADLYQLLGLCSRDKADAIFKKDSQAFNYFEKAEQILFNSLFSSSKEGTPLEKDYQLHCQSIGKCYYRAGKTLLRGDEKASALCVQAAQCLEDSYQQDVSRSLKKAAFYYMEAGFALQNNEKEKASLYELAGDCRRNAARTLNQEAAQEWKKTAECYLNIIQEQKEPSEHHDAVIQLFKSAATYGSTTAQIIEENPDQDQNITKLLTTTALHLQSAGQALQRGDEELSTAYKNGVASFHHLIIAKDPALLEKFPAQFQRGFKKELVRNLGLIEYWRKAVQTNDQKIRKLFEKHISAASQVEEDPSKKARVI